MQFLKNITQKKLAKAVVCGLLVSGGVFVSMDQAYADTFISGAEYDSRLERWNGTNVTLSDIKGEHEYEEFDDSIQGSGTNNTLNVEGFIDFPINKISTFQNLNFYINDTDPVMIRHVQLLHTNHFDWGSVKNVNAYVKEGCKLAVGDRVMLLHVMYNWLPQGDNEELTTFCKAPVNDFQDYEFEIKRELENYLIARVKGIKRNVESNDKSPVETQAAALTMLTTGADMLARQGFDNAASAVAGEITTGGSANTLTPFITMGGAKTKVKTGSHVDVKGWNLNVGFAKEVKNKAGKLLIGPVVEYGKGSYDSYLDKGFHGAGDTRYIGGGVMAKQTNNNGLYYEGSLRAGKLDNDYKSHGISSNSYDSNSTYYAAHVGVGKIVKLNEKNSLDYYGKYFYTHQKGDGVTMHAGGEDYDLRFDSVDSNRTRIGARYTRAMNEKNSIYAGLAWQHEFSGTARATMDGTGIPAPSVKGDTGIMELGWKVEAGRKLDLDLGATGYTGKQKGARLNLAVNYKF